MDFAHVGQERLADIVIQPGNGEFFRRDGADVPFIHLKG